MMNERIKLLAEQAKKYALDAMIKITDKEQALKVYSETYDTQFAELIVRECAKVCDDLDIDDWGDKSFDDGTYYCSRAIKQHFGVEE
jgi:hypothetical protein